MLKKFLYVTILSIASSMSMAVDLVKHMADEEVISSVSDTILRGGRYQIEWSNHYNVDFNHMDKEEFEEFKKESDRIILEFKEEKKRRQF